MTENLFGSHGVASVSTWCCGSRSSIRTPGGAWIPDNHAGALERAFAEAVGSSGLVQAGIYAVNGSSLDGTCNSPATQQFTETIDTNGVPACTAFSTLATCSVHLYSAARSSASNPTWHAYIDGVTRATVTFTVGDEGAGGEYAHTLGSAISGYINAIFGGVDPNTGANVTPWQLNNGSSWNTVTGGYGSHIQSPWVVPNVGASGSNSAWRATIGSSSLSC